MGRLFLINGLGVVIGAAMAGRGFSDGVTPYFSMIACIVFFFGLSFPFIREYRSVDRGFDTIEDEFLEEDAKEGDVDVFIPGERAKSRVMTEKNRPRLVLVVVAFLGFGLLLAEGVQRFTAPDQEPPRREGISNF